MRPRVLSGRFVALLGAQTAFGYAFSSFLLLPKFLALEFGASASQIGVVAAVYAAANMIAMLAVGVWVDRYGRRVFLVGGALLMAATSLCFLAVDEIGPLLYTLRALHGVAFAMGYVGGATLAVDLAPPERLGQVIGIFGLSMLSMNAVAPAVVEALVESHGWSLAFAGAVAAAGLSAALGLMLRDARARRPVEEGRDASLWQMIRRPQQRRIAVVMTIVGAAYATMLIFSQPFALSLGFERLRSFFLAYTAVAAGARLLLGPFVDRLGRRPISVLSLGLYAAVVAAMSQLGAIGLAPIGAAFGLAHGLFYPAYNALAVEASPERERGKVMALFQGWFNAGGAIGALALGVVADLAGYPSVFLAMAVVTTGALALLLAPQRRA